MTIIHSVLPDLTRPDTDTVLIVETSAVMDEVFGELEQKPWPAGLLSFSTFAATDDETVLAYTQWAAGAADHEFLSGLTGGMPVEYRHYRGQTRENPPLPGCIVVVKVEFDGPDEQRQRRWVDTVFEALEGEAEPHPGGISGHFHVSADGTRVLNYAEWTDEQAHRDALENSRQGTVGSSPGWQRVLDFPGVRDSGFRRYQPMRSLSAPQPAAQSEKDGVSDSPTDWVAEHIRAYVETNGESGHLYQGWPTLLLTTKGRKSGTLRRTALIYAQDGDRYLLVASNAGAEHHPAWYLNLDAHPEVTVQVRDETFPARARTATAEEKRLLWNLTTAVFPLYDTYQAKSSRDLPLVIIERRAGKEPSNP